MPRALDLFCCAGGASEGLRRAGFEVVGVDIEPQPHYPFEFHQADALTFPLDGFDFIWASPPCQAYTLCQRIQKNEHPDLVAPIRERLHANGAPYCIENVPGAPLVEPIELCGTMFGLRTYQVSGNAGLYMGIPRASWPGKFSTPNINLGGKALTPAITRAPLSVRARS